MWHLLLIMSLLFPAFLNPAYPQEELIITTYFPSPVGVYRRLRSDEMSIGGTYIDDNEPIPPDSLIVESQLAIRQPFTAIDNATLQIGTASNIEILFRDDPTRDPGDPPGTLGNANIEAQTSNSFYIGTAAPGRRLTDPVTGLPVSQGSIQFFVGDPNTSTINPKLAIGENGNVGIGTPAPTYPLTTLHVRGDSILAADSQDVETARIRYVPDYFGAGGSSDAVIIEKTDNDKSVEGGMILGFSTSAADNTNSYLSDGTPNPDWAVNFKPAMTIYGNGQIGVGLSTMNIAGDTTQIPWGGPFVVHGTSSNDNAFRIFSDSNGNYMNFWVTDRLGTSSIAAPFLPLVEAGHIQMGDADGYSKPLVMQQYGGGVNIPSGLQVGNEVMAGQILARGNTSLGPQVQLSTGRWHSTPDEFFIEASSREAGTPTPPEDRRRRFSVALDGSAFFAGPKVDIQPGALTDGSVQNADILLNKWEWGSQVGSAGTQLIAGPYEDIIMPLGSLDPGVWGLEYHYAFTVSLKPDKPGHIYIRLTGRDAWTGGWEDLGTAPEYVPYSVIYQRPGEYNTHSISGFFDAPNGPPGIGKRYYQFKLQISAETPDTNVTYFHRNLRIWAVQAR